MGVTTAFFKQTHTNTFSELTAPSKNLCRVKGERNQTGQLVVFHVKQCERAFLEETENTKSPRKNGDSELPTQATFQGITGPTFGCAM